MSLHDQRYRQVIQRLVAARKRKGLSQVAVAQRLRLDPQEPDKRPPQSFVSKCETRERRLDVIELAEFARVYEVTVGELLGESGASLAAEGSGTGGASVSTDGERRAPTATSPPPPRARGIRPRRRRTD